MTTIKSVLQSRSMAGGDAIEVDFILEDGSTHTLRIPYEQAPHTMHAITSAAAAAETTQKVKASGRPSFAVVVPYRAMNMKAGQSYDGQIVAAFATPQGPVQVAMTAQLAQRTIERLKAELESLGKQQFPRPS
jgi:hypothetical protein